MPKKTVIVQHLIPCYCGTKMGRSVSASQKVEGLCDKHIRQDVEKTIIVQNVILSD